ncbi:MAG: DNA repair protein RecO [Bacteroidales bacterium]
MIDWTAAIALHNFRYSDSGIVVHFFTEKFGRLPVMIKGAGNRKAGKHKIYLQPLSVIDIVLYYKESREIQTLKEFSPIYTPAGIYGNLIKSSIAMFLGEVLASVLREESPNREMFGYLLESIKYFDKCESGIPNFHIGFLAGLCSYLGIEPGKRSVPEHVIFDFQNGHFVQVPPTHGNYACREVSDILARVFSSSWNNIKNIPMTGQLRNEVLTALLKYYMLHFPSLKKINSLDVLREVFQSST